MKELRRNTERTKGILAGEQKRNFLYRYGAGRDRLKEQLRGATEVKEV